MKFCDIHIRDPFILPEDGKYYLYGSRGETCWGPASGFDVYVSDDLENWSQPTAIFENDGTFWSNLHYWAPEVHKYKGSYYLFASFNSETRHRGTQILKSDSPTGPFVPISDGPVTPSEWECLDGTLYVEDGVPYIVFCHEWVQCKDGEMYALQLTDDLTDCVGEPILLFKASSFKRVRTVKDRGNGEDGWYVTDGPFMYTTAEGKLLMIWSSFSKEGGYCELISYPDNNKIDGKWICDDRCLFEKNGGHGMIFKSFDGKLYFIAHTPNTTPKERPVLFEICEKDGSLYIK